MHSSTTFLAEASTVERRFSLKPSIDEQIGFHLSSSTVPANAWCTWAFICLNRSWDITPIALSPVLPRLMLGANWRGEGLSNRFFPLWFAGQEPIMMPQTFHHSLGETRQTFRFLRFLLLFLSMWTLRLLSCFFHFPAKHTTRTKVSPLCHNNGSNNQPGGLTGPHMHEQPHVWKVVRLRRCQNILALE